jgi:hypothetical protein
MYLEDHNPPHFHATYGEFEILICITDLYIYAGYIPGKSFKTCNRMGVSSPGRFDG